LEGYLKAYGFTIRSKANPNGQISVAHYMTIAQKIMSEIMRLAYLVVIPRLSRSYDFKADEFKVKNKTHKKLLEKRMAGNITKEDFDRITQVFTGAKNISGFDPSMKLEYVVCTVVRYIHLDDAFQGNVKGTNIPYSLVMLIVEQINRKSGTMELIINDKKLVEIKDPTTGETSKYYKYRITDNTLKPKAGREPKAATILPSSTFAPVPVPTRERLRYLPKPKATTLRGFAPKSATVQLQSPVKIAQIIGPKISGPPLIGTPTPPGTPTGSVLETHMDFDVSDAETDIELKKKD
jgi:hypothetical protein